MVFACLGGCIVILRFCLLMSVFWWFGCGGVGPYLLGYFGWYCFRLGGCACVVVGLQIWLRLCVNCVWILGLSFGLGVAVGGWVGCLVAWIGLLLRWVCRCSWFYGSFID